MHRSAVHIKKVQIGTTVPNRYIRVIPNDTDGLIAPLEAHGELRAQISGAESPGSTLQTDPFSAALSPALVVHLGPYNTERHWSDSLQPETQCFQPPNGNTRKHKCTETQSSGVRLTVRFEPGSCRSPGPKPRGERGPMSPGYWRARRRCRSGWRRRKGGAVVPKK